MDVLKVVIKTENGVSVPTINRFLYALLKYPAKESSFGEESNELFDGIQEERILLSEKLEGETEVWDWDSTSTEFEVRIQSSFGLYDSIPPLPLDKPKITIAKEDKTCELLVILDQNKIDAIIKSFTPPTLDSGFPAFLRKGQFIILGEKKGNLPKSILIACMPEKPAKNIIGEGSQRIIQSDKINDINSITNLEFTTVRMGANGSFEFCIPISKSCAGWLWLLPGKATTIGWVDDPVIIKTAEDVKQNGAQDNLPPPAPKAPISIILATESVCAATPDKDEKQSPCACSMASGQIPADATEQDLLDNADVYGEDPGTYCEPFRNPNRILSEKTFFTVFRVQEPAIGGLSSLYPTPVIPLPRVGISNPTAVSTAPSSSSADSHVLVEGNSSNLAKPSLLRRLFTSAKAEVATPIVTTSSTPLKTDTFAKSTLAASGDAVSRWQNLLSAKRGKVGSQVQGLLPRLRIPPILGTTGRRPVAASSPIDWEGDASRTQATTVGLGHVLEFRLRWRSNGYSLGDVLHTLTLAPRQTKRITTIQWERTERASRTEKNIARDTVEQKTTSERQYSDVVQSSLNEWSKGSSKSSMTGAAAGVGGVAGPVVFGGGVAHSQAQSASEASGGRDIAAQEEQSLRDAVRQYADSLRQFESTVVTEISQEEVVTGISEILRNPNYCHALTVVYHQILRHLRVDTELAGVRECAFVPLAIKPFTLERTIRWRDIIGRRLMAEDLRWVLKYLDELKAGWPDESVPAGPRCSHPIRYISGSIFVKLAIQRPPDKDDDSFDESTWGVYSRLTREPLFGIFGRLKERAIHLRDAYFQSEIAPSLAREWANTLQLLHAKKIVKQPIGRMNRNIPDGSYFTPIENVDFTLTSSYQYGGSIRIDFSCVISPGTNIRREDLESIKIIAGNPLAKGSIANFLSMNMHYETDTFQYDVNSPQSENDLLDPGTGAVDTNGAIARIRFTSWELQDLRKEIEVGANRLLAHLNEHTEYYHKSIWWGMDRDRLFMLLDGFLVPGDPSRSLASVLERDPMTIVGNSLVFRVSAGAYLNVGGLGSPGALRRWYLRSQSPREPLRISLPTSGLYAKALMDKCNACEEHMGSVDWVLTDNEPELEKIGPEGLQSRRAEPTGTTPTPFQAPIINLMPAQAAPAPTGLGSILEAVTKSDAFRDMAGLAGTQANAATAMQTAASLASEFGSKALELQKAKQATSDAPQKLQNIRRAQEDGLIEKEDARDLTQSALKDMSVSSREARLTEEPIVKNVLDKASAVPGTPIQVRRGGEAVSVGTMQASSSVSMPEELICQAPVSAIEIVKAANDVLEKNEGIGYVAANGKKYTHTLKDSNNCPVVGIDDYPKHTHCNFFVYKFVEKLIGKTLDQLTNDNYLPDTNNMNANGFVDFMKKSTKYSKLKDDDSDENALECRAAKDVAFDYVLKGEVVIATYKATSGPGHLAILVSPFAIDAAVYPKLSKATASDPPIVQCGSSDGFMTLSQGFGNRSCDFYLFNRVGDNN